MKHRPFIFGAFLALAVMTASSGYAAPKRIVNDNDRVTLHGNLHPDARSDADLGRTDTKERMERMVLALKVAPERQAELDRLLADQQDPASSDYHHWLTPAEFGLRFGPTPDDLAAVTSWLAGHGFTIDEVAKGGGWINFSGTVAQVNSAFGTEIHDYLFQGKVRHANAANPTIPRALADLVHGPVSLHNFPRKPMNTGIKALATNGKLPEYTYGSSHYLSPGDFSAIYNVSPLYASGIDGTGQSIAIVGRTHPSGSNWSAFRSMMGLPANAPQVIVNGTDPGDLGSNEDGEADLDVEWAGAVAKNAVVKFVVSQSTSSTDGVDLSAQYIVNNNVAPVMSTSFGQCESAMGSAENAFYNNLWSQAAAQGITSFVAAGDSGAAGCSAASATVGSGAAVNGLASTPYNVAVGGTQLSEGSGSYWSSSNGSYYTSATGYIPEVAWNESGNVSGGTQLWATGGGTSSVYSKPSWQSAPGVPADGRRDVPDVALSAAGHDAYLVETGGSLSAVSGTSASSPSFAGLMALVAQKTGQRQGNANGRLYQLATAQYGSAGAAVFHDTLTGNNSVPGVTGYACGTGYDLSTGLGSVDASALVNNWSSTGSGTVTNPDFTVSAASTSLGATQGTSTSTTVTVGVTGGFSNTVSFAVSGLPGGATGSLAPASLPAPGSGSSTLTLSAGSTTAAGSYPVTVTASGGGKTHSVTVTFTVTAATATSTTLFSDGFEGSGWYAAQVSGTAGKWSIASAGKYPSAAPHGGKYLADFNSHSAASGSQTRLYRGTGFTVPSTATSATLKFWMYHDSGAAAYNDRIQVQLSTNGTTWTNVGTPFSRYSTATGWTQGTLDLTPYKGQTVRLGFLGTSARGNDIYLDDVSVSAQ